MADSAGSRGESGEAVNLAEDALIRGGAYRGVAG